MSIWGFLLTLILLAIILVQLGVIAIVVLGPHLPAGIASASVDKLLRWAKANKNTPKMLAAICIGLAISCAGCDGGPSSVQRIRVREPEFPVCNLPADMHQRNRLGPQGQGSCVHASLKNHLLWLNQPELAEKWWTTYGDGEYASRLMRRLDAAGIPYRYTERADPRFLDWCTLTRRGAIIWWKPAHCCTFMGFSLGRDILRSNPAAQVQPSVLYAVILDNNYPGRWEYTERQQFIRLWAGYGGFALAVMDDPAVSIPYQAYEVYP